MLLKTRFSYFIFFNTEKAEPHRAELEAEPELVREHWPSVDVAVWPEFIYVSHNDQNVAYACAVSIQHAMKRYKWWEEKDA